MEHTFDFDSGDGRAFDRREQRAPQAVADGGAEPAFKRLSVKLAISICKGFGLAGRETAADYSRLASNAGLRVTCHLSPDA